MNLPRIFWIVVTVIFLVIPDPTIFAQEEEQDLDALEIPESMQEQEETLEVLETVWAEETSIASRVTTSIEEAPSIVMVITAQQIRDMGARTLQDVMKIVPSFDALPYEAAGFPADTYIGTLSVLVLHNGARLNDYYIGSSSGTEYQIFLENVARIEIISGPGSALYGANAFAGVINIITKTPAQIDGIQIGDERLSFEGQRYHLLAGKQFGDWSASAFAQYFEDEGQKFFIPADQNGQSGHIRDKQMGALDLDLQAGYKNLALELRYLQRKPHMFFGDMIIQPPSDRNLRLETETFALRGVYQRALFNENGLFKIHTEYKRTLLELQATLGYPRQLYNKVPTDDVAGEVSFRHSFFKRKNTATVGVRLGRERLFDAVQKINFDSETLTYTGSMVAGLSNNPDSDRTILSAYAEDVWKLSEHVQLTLGARLDHYTQFGSTVNPRCSFVYTPTSDITVRLLYGRAFRAPTAIEAYDTNFGAEGVEPEIVNSYSAGISYDLFDIWTIRGYLSRGTIDDMIFYVEDLSTYSGFIYKNIGNAESREFGFEIKGTYRFGYVWANYFHLNAEIEGATGEKSDSGEPEDFASAGLNIEIGKYLNVNAWGYFRGERLLEAEENAVKIDDYTNINLNVRVQNLLKNLEGYLTVYNLLDPEYELPGSHGLTIPMRGREIIGGIRYIF